MFDITTIEQTFYHVNHQFKKSQDNYQSTDLSENLDEAERNALWNADETVVYWNEWYVRKGNTVIRIEFSTLPDAEQIQKIAAKLGL